jgi:hypothetical protein
MNLKTFSPTTSETTDTLTTGTRGLEITCDPMPYLHRESSHQRLMTYKELLEQLTEEQLNQNVAIISEDDPDDYYQFGLELVFVTDERGIVHPIIQF